MSMTRPAASVRYEVVERHPAPLILREIKIVAESILETSPDMKFELAPLPLPVAHYFNLPAKSIVRDIVVDDQTKKKIQEIIDEYISNSERHIISMPVGLTYLPVKPMTDDNT